jgi:DNA mismatch repair protein MutS
LDQLREIARSGKSFIARLESSEREATKISNLRVKYNRVFGYFIEVTKSQLHLVPKDYIRKQTLVNCERFITPELKEYEEKVLSAEEQSIGLEKELFVEVRSRVGSQAQRIREAARTLGQIDVLLAFAENSRKHRYVRPILEDSTELLIRAGRHAVLEQQGKEPFVPNDLHCNTSTDQLMILTGPNMGGKSTFLRQNALIVIMAQMGSFVPAEEARIGLVDRIFTRVGASDNLSRGRSTFMVEMIETANILNTATPHSLILLDEVGRGTATFDGLSLAWSIAEYLHNEPTRKARTLFATHYQELTKLDQLYDGVKNYCVTIRESNGQIVFFHRVTPGSASKSYGIEVARLAGLPIPVLERSREILARLEKKELNLSGKPRSSSSHQVLDDLQRALF